MTPSMPRVQSGVASGNNQSLNPSTNINGASPSPPPGRISPNSLEEKQNGQQHASTTNEITRGGSYKRTLPLRPVIPDQDGFVPMSPRKKDSDARKSVYDNVPQGQILTDANVFGYGNHLRNSVNRGSVKHSRDYSGSSGGSNRVRHAANNVTYVEISGEEQPNIPKPDYDGNNGGIHGECFIYPQLTL